METEAATPPRVCQHRNTTEEPVQQGDKIVYYNIRCIDCNLIIGTRTA